MVQNGTIPEEKFSRRQLAALPHLLKPGSIAQQARNAGIGRTTLNRWLQDHRFRTRIERLREDIHRLAETELQAISYDAVAVIYDALQHDDPGVRLHAARLALQFANDARYGQNLERRVETLVNAARLRKDNVWRPP